jgi:type IV secretion system protein VirB4
MSIQGISLTPQQSETISDALEQFSRCSVRSLSAFQISLQDQVLKSALIPYLSSGPVGDLFDGEDDSLSLQSFTTFEMEHVMNLGERYVLPLLFYLFRRIERELNGQPSLIILDEAWVYLSHPLFSAKIREWLKVLRKANCALIMASQSLSDVEGSDIGDVISQECRTKVFLANGSAGTPVQSTAYYRLGLSEEDVGIIESLTPKREYYAVSERGRAVFNLALGSTELSYLTGKGQVVPFPSEIKRAS